VRELECQSFRVIRSSERMAQPKVEPRTVINSRLTSLAENFQASGCSKPAALDKSLLR
tara:strand:+ start:128 stop:301 length:174 start_codon:yes stop_codon:yes gene_type:complete